MAHLKKDTTVGGINVYDQLTEVTSQLAQTDKRIPNIANATSTLKILNPYGNFQNIHPKVLYFKDGWNGYKWWMAYTPYPFGNTRQENPCLAVSNNGLDWGVPEGFENIPLEEWNDIEGSYNNDTHLVFRDDLNRLEIWWRTVYSETRVVHLKRRTSTDGVNWTETEIMFTGTQDTDDHISPALIYEDGKYKMLSVNTENNIRVLRYSESVDGKNWGERVHTDVEWGGIFPWHMDFVKDNGKYKMVMQGLEHMGGNNTASLYYMESQDLISWTKPVKILSPSALPDSFDNQGIYRSSLVIIDGVYYVFYSAISTTGERAMALSYGENIYALKGYSPNIENLSQLKLTKEGNGVILKPDENITNKLDLIQTTRTSNYGHLKLGHLFFDDGNVSTTTPDKSVLRYNAMNDVHEKFNGSKWTGISTKVFVRLDQEIPLVSGEFVDIPFNVIDLNNGRYANGLYTPISTDRFKVTIGLTFRDVNEGDSLEIQIKNKNNADIFLVWRGKLNPDNKIQHISAVVPFMTNQAWKVSVKYTGSSSSARTTNYPHQNRMLIEGF